MRIFLIPTLFLSLSLFGATQKEIEEFKLSTLKSNRQVTINSIKVLSKTPLEGWAKGWEAAIILLDFSINRGSKIVQMKTSDMVFVNGDLISDDISHIKKKVSAKEEFAPKLDSSCYNPQNLIAGNVDAKQKVVVFSDPLCPFCRDLIPDIIAAASKNPSKLALYHYSFPLLTLHPASEALSKAEIALRGSYKDRAALLTKLYSTAIEPNETDEAKIAAKLSSELGVKLQKSDITSKEVQKEYDKELTAAYKMLIRGTPTVFINGERDSSKSKINHILKELK